MNNLNKKTILFISVFVSAWLRMVAYDSASVDVYSMIQVESWDPLFTQHGQR